jgi:protein-S-isoprenylcysteine O-methyltransferase
MAPRSSARRSAAARGAVIAANGSTTGRPSRLTELMIAVLPDPCGPARRSAHGDPMTQLVLGVVVALFPISEIALAFVKRSGGGAHSEDRGSLRLLWLSIAFGVGLAIVAQWIPSARVPGAPFIIRSVALGLLVGGLALRWAAILMLGRLFTVDGAIHSDRVVVQAGLYRLVRHPSYTGLLVAFLGLGLFFANWLSIFALLLPITLAVLNRVGKEEQALLTALGSEYGAYCARTKRFIPGLL